MKLHSIALLALLATPIVASAADVRSKGPFDRGEQSRIEEVSKYLRALFAQEPTARPDVSSRPQRNGAARTSTKRIALNGLEASSLHAAGVLTEIAASR